MVMRTGFGGEPSRHTACLQRKKARAKRKEDDEIERVRRDLELARKRIEKLHERKQKYLELREAAESRRRDFLRMTRPIEGKQNSLALERPNSAR